MMRLLRLAILCFILLISTTVFAQSSLRERGYGIYIPTYYAADSDPLPLMIALHGFGDEWRNFSTASGLVDAAESYGFIVAFPNGYLRQWNDGSVGAHYEDDVAILLQLIEVIADSYTIDRNRIYLVGFSNGGTMTFKAACEAPGVFAGIASVGGRMRMAQECEPEARTSVVMIHGTEDIIEPLSASNGRYSVLDGAAFWVELNACQTDQLPSEENLEFESNIGFLYYDNCTAGHLVLVYIIQGLPHVWPRGYEQGSNRAPNPRIDAPFVIWGFFQASYDSQQAARAEVTPEATSEVED